MITLSKSGNSVTFTFDENSGYLQNGTIDVPINSLALITDESDMATFRKSASNDIFISARYEEFGMSKAELEAWYKANMVSSGGGGGTGGTTPEEVQTMIDESISGKADTSAVTVEISEAVSGKQDTLIEGRAIDITNNTVSLDLPISADTGAYSIAEGRWTAASGGYSHAEGFSSGALGDYSHAEGYQTLARGSYSHTEGYNTEAKNDYEHVSGQFNNSVSATTTFGDSGNTLFSVGNGDAFHKHNTLDIRQNGDIYIADTSGSGEYYQKTMIKLQDALGGGGVPESAFTAYTAATDSRLAEDEEVSARALNDLDERKLDASAYTPVDLSDYYTTAQTDSAITASVSGKASQSDLETVSGQVANKQDQLVSGTNIKTINNISLLGSGNIDIQGGGGTGTCTVDETTIYDIYSGAYSNDALDMRVNYVVLDYTGDKTLGNASVEVNFRDANYNTYVNQYINFDYSTNSYTLNDQSQAEYIDITYDPTIEDFKIAVASAYTSTVFVGRIGNFWGNYIKVPFYTISSGSPCTVIENDVTSAISSVRDGVFKALRTVNVTSQKTQLNIYSETIGGASNSFSVKFDEIDGSNNTLKPDIYVGLGTSGWTEINVTEQCSANNLKATKYRVTYDYSEFNAYNMNLTLYASWVGNMQNDYVTFDEQTQQPSLQSSTFTGATVDWNASTKELVITYPTTIDWYGEQVSVNIDQIYSNNCQFGQTIIKLESYGEDKQALKPYVQETRAALGGLSLIKLTQAQYDALAPDYDSNTLYVIVN